jgi:hypothetical protein
MNVEPIAIASVRCRDHEGLAVDHEANVAQKSFVENAIYSFAIIDTTVRLADQTGPRRWSIGLGHGRTNSGQAPRMGEEKV